MGDIPPNELPIPWLLESSFDWHRALVHSCAIWAGQVERQFSRPLQVCSAGPSPLHVLGQTRNMSEQTRMTFPRMLWGYHEIVQPPILEAIP